MIHQVLIATFAILIYVFTLLIQSHLLDTAFLSQQDNAKMQMVMGKKTLFSEIIFEEILHHFKLN